MSNKGFRIFGKVKVLDGDWKEIDKIKGDWADLNKGLDKYLGGGKKKNKR